MRSQSILPTTPHSGSTPKNRPSWLWGMAEWYHWTITERFTRWGAIQRVLFHKRKKIGADHYRAPRSRVGLRRCSVSLPTPPLGKEQVPVARSTPPGCGARAFWSAPAPDLGEIPIGRSRVHQIPVPKVLFSSKIMKNKILRFLQFYASHVLVHSWIFF